LRAFVQDSDSARTMPGFPCVSDDVASVLRTLGFSSTMFGSELALPLLQFQLSKRHRKFLRTAAAHGLECRSTCTDIAELERVNNAWLGNKPCQNEVLLMTFPPSLPQPGVEVEQDEVRRLFTYQNGRLVGFLIAEPYYRNGHVVGYVLNTTRFTPNLKPCWASEFAFASLVEALQLDARIEFLAFGVSPLTELHQHVGELEWLRGLMQGVWESGDDSLYSCHGLAAKKVSHCCGQGIRLPDKFICIRYSDGGLNVMVRFMFLLLGVDVLKACQQKWLWSWLAGSMVQAVQTRSVGSCSGLLGGCTALRAHEIVVD